MKKLALLAAMVLVLSSIAFAGATSLTGTVSDSMCGAKHAEASDAAAKCVANCVKGGSKYVLVSGGKVYELDAQDKFAAFAGKSVKVTGEVKDMAITVTSVEAAN